MRTHQLLRITVLCLGLLTSSSLAQAQDPALDTALEYLQNNVKSLGLVEADLDALVVTDQYVSRHNGVTHIYLQQYHDGVPVFNGIINVNVTQDGQVLNVGNRFIARLAERVTSSTAGLPAVSAVEAAATHLGLTITDPLTVLQSTPGARQETLLSDGGIARESIPAELVYQPLENGEVRLAWNVGIDVAGGVDWWQVRVDAASGQVLDQNNWTAEDTWGVSENPNVMGPAPGAESFPFAENPDSYRVFPLPAESPQHPSPGGTAHTVETDPADGTFSPFGWHDTDGTVGAEFTITRGNNVHAYEDRDGDDIPPSPSNEPDGGAMLDFDFAFDPTMDPLVSIDAATVNLFYWNNIIHDIMAVYGFDEPGGNFQQTNYTALGLGGDYVQAEAQARADQPPSGTTRCNANFGTPADGGAPRMRMYVCDNTTPFRDGDYDNGVIVHEYGHGISNRLTGGPANVSCLTNDEQAGEGWSDFYALMLSQQVGDAGPDARSIGTYLFGQAATGPGIRARPYSTSFAVNEFTYDTIIGTGGSPHALGHVWATMLWDLNWALIGDGDNGSGGGSGFDPDFYTGTGGNNLALQLVTDGLKLQPCSPGFVDGRDAILAADVALTGGTNECTIWTAFAQRGLGFSADQGSSGSRTDGTEAFDMPPSCLDLTITKTASPSPVSDGSVLLYTLEVAAQNNAQTNVVVMDTIPNLTTYVPGSASDSGSESGGVVTFPPIATISAGTMVTRTFEVTVNTGGSGGVLFMDDMESGPGNWTATHGDGTFDWALGATNPHSGTMAWFAADVVVTSDQYLAQTSAVALNALSTLRFWHDYDTEATWDGGVVEISTDGGANWTDLGPNMIQNGYNSIINVNPASPISGREAFSGDSDGYLETIVDLSSFAGPTAQIRFRFATDGSVGGVGWYVDDVKIANEAFIANVACASSTETPSSVCDEIVTQVLLLTTRYVSTTGSDTANDCTNPASPCLTLGHAVSEASDGDIIDLDAGTYNEPGLVITKRVMIIGSGVVVQ